MLSRKTIAACWYMIMQAGHNDTTSCNMSLFYMIMQPCYDDTLSCKQVTMIHHHAIMWQRYIIMQPCHDDTSSYNHVASSCSHVTMIHHDATMSYHHATRSRGYIIMQAYIMLKSFTESFVYHWQCGWQTHRHQHIDVGKGFVSNAYLLRLNNLPVLYCT